MESINGIRLTEFPIKNLHKTADLIYFDGPFLSLFEGEKKEKFLYYWCDVNDTCNRWIVFEATPKNLMDYLMKQIALQHLLLNPEGNVIYTVDLDNELQFCNIFKLSPENLPESYIPEEDSFYEFEPIFLEASNPLAAELNRRKIEKKVESIGFRFDVKTLDRFQPPSLSKAAMRELNAVAKSFRQFSEQNRFFLEHLESQKGLYDIATRNADFLKRVTEDWLPLQTELGEIVKNLSLADLSIGNLFKSTDAIAGTLADSLAFQEHWKEQLHIANSNLGLTGTAQIALQAHLAEVSEIAILSQELSSKIPWSSLGNTLGLASELQTTLQNDFSAFAGSYSDLFRAFEEQPELIISSPFISKLPAIEVFNEINLLGSITEGYSIDSDILDEMSGVREMMLQETPQRIHLLLDKLSGDISREFLLDPKIDFTRVQSISMLQELIEQLIETIAPDESIKSWNKEQDSYEEKSKPTRVIRLSYLSRYIHQQFLTTFLEKDVNSPIEFLNLFYHKIQDGAECTQEQLELLIIRIRSMVRLLLEIWDYNLHVEAA